MPWPCVIWPHSFPPSLLVSSSMKYPAGIILGWIVSFFHFTTSFSSHKHTLHTPMLWEPLWRYYTFVHYFGSFLAKRNNHSWRKEWFFSVMPRVCILDRRRTDLPSWKYCFLHFLSPSSYGPIPFVKTNAFFAVTVWLWPSFWPSLLPYILGSHLSVSPVSFNVISSVWQWVFFILLS